MQKFLFISLFVCSSLTLFGQSYKSAAGVRLGAPLAASYKTFLNETAAVEGILGFANFNSSVNYFNIRAAYLIHKDIDSVNNLQWYYGAGAGLFFWSFNDSFLGDRSTTTGIGLSGYIGLEYTFPDTPIAITADWAPTFILSGFGSGFGAGYGAFGVRYILGR